MCPEGSRPHQLRAERQARGLPTAGYEPLSAASGSKTKALARKPVVSLCGSLCCCRCFVEERVSTDLHLVVRCAPALPKCMLPEYNSKEVASSYMIPSQTMSDRLIAHSFLSTSLHQTSSSALVLKRARRSELPSIIHPMKYSIFVVILYYFAVHR